MTSNPESNPNFKITLSPKKKTEKVLPQSNSSPVNVIPQSNTPPVNVIPQTQTNKGNSQSLLGNPPENTKQPAQPPTQSTPKPQNSPTQAEIAAANQKRETEQALHHLKISVVTSQDKTIYVDYKNRLTNFQAQIDKITMNKNPHSEFTIAGLDNLKLNTESLSRSVEELKEEWANIDDEIADLLSNLKESIFKVEDIKVNYNAYTDPNEKRLMEMMPIESHESEKRNYFRTKLNNTTFLINLLQKEISEIQSKRRFKKPTAIDNSLNIEKMALDNLRIIQQKTLILDELEKRVQRLHVITRGESMERGYDDDDSDTEEMDMSYHVREMSLAPTEDGRRTVKKILLHKMNRPDKSKT